MSIPEQRVCPRCGTPAGEREYCETCGLALHEQPELPTREQWERSPAARSDALPPRPPSRPRPKPGTVEYLINACYWTIGLSSLMPLLALPAWGFAFLVILRGRRDMGLWLFFLASFVAAGSALIWALIFGAFSGGTGFSGGTEGGG